MQDVDSKNSEQDNVIHFNFKGGRMIKSAQSVSEMADRWEKGPTELFPPQKGGRTHGGGQAKMLRASDLRAVLAFIETKRSSPEADRVKLCLSLMAGLRACEIAGLQVSDVTNADGSTASFLRIRANISKSGRAREVPICPELRQAINAFRARYPDSDWLAVSHRFNTVKHQSANAVTVWFRWLYRQSGLEKCSSHSGRRTFITLACRNLPRECSVRDVQVMVGHRRLDTTQAYIESSPNMQSVTNVVGSLLVDAGSEGAPE